MKSYYVLHHVTAPVNYFFLQKADHFYISHVSSKKKMSGAKFGYDPLKYLRTELYKELITLFQLILLEEK